MNKTASEQGRQAYLYLTPPEIRFLDAAVDCLIPADELGAGARDAGVTVFIDRQLASAWGGHVRNYRQGPWQQGTPQQGYQFPLTPREIYRECIREIDDHCLRCFGSLFFCVDRSKQEEVLRAMDTGSIPLDALPSKVFFELLWTNTQEGFFSDPMYGGNRDKAGWKLIGFPGIPSSAYTDCIHRHNTPYRVEPVGIQDVLDGKVELDPEGFPKHCALPPEERCPS